MTRLNIKWLDAGREPRVAPDPAYPDGVDVNCSLPGFPSCKVDLPYPAPRIGSYVVKCKICACRVVLTTAGRRDDPRSVTVPCRPMARA